MYCRCWKSGTFPYCDGAHVAHNKATGDNVGPLIVTAEKKQNDEDQPAAVSEETKTVENEGANEKVAEEIIEVAKVSEEKKLTFMDKLKRALGLKNNDPDGPTTRERLAKMGLSALLSYGWVSNMSQAVTLSLSWYGFSKKVGNHHLFEWNGMTTHFPIFLTEIRHTTDWTKSSCPGAVETIPGSVRRILRVQQYYSPTSIWSIGDCLQVF